MASAPPDAVRLDTRYAAETPEGIALALRPAGVVPRCYAYLIDLLIRVGVFAVFAIVLGQLGGFGFGLSLLLIFLLEWLYPVAFELGAAAATPGKRALGLTVVMDSGLPVTPAASLTRNLLRAADFLPAFNAFGVVSMLLRPDFKRLGDLAAGTLVVHAHERRIPVAELPAAVARPPAVPLTARAQAAVVGWAGRVQRLTAARADELAEIAVPTVAPRAQHGDRVGALVGVAHWLLGRR
ncbi:MAG: RDD family protein [Caldimonas sp.]